MRGFGLLMWRSGCQKIATNTVVVVMTQKSYSSYLPYHYSPVDEKLIFVQYNKRKPSGLRCKNRMSKPDG